MPTRHNDIALCVINEQDISPELDRAIRETLVVCFPADREYFGRQSWWHCVPIYRVFGRDDEGSVVAHVAVVERTVIVGPDLSKPPKNRRACPTDKPLGRRVKLRVAGIQSCCVLPDYRGTGLSDKMMSVAMAEAKRRGFDAGLLFCLDQLKTVYGRMGWSKLDAAVYMADDKEGKPAVHLAGKTLIPAKNITMFYPLKAKRFPAGDIDLVGTDW